MITCGRALFALTLATSALVARAEPHIAVQQGYACSACSACHVDGMGGGLRTDFGIVVAGNMLPARTVEGLASRWTGRVGELLRVGADLRWDWTRTAVPDRAPLRRSELEQLRAYAAAEIVPDRLTIYLDELVSPGNATTQEAFVRYGSTTAGWYAQAGRFYLPFGWRLQDGTAFVREVSGIGMSTPDDGAEVGWSDAAWSTALAVTNGIANAGSGHGSQATLHAQRLFGAARLGASVSRTASPAGARTAYGAFGGLRTGPLVWLGELDVVRDASFPDGTRTLAAAFGEVDWFVARGHDVKLVLDWRDPDAHVAQDAQARYSLIYEWTPVPFLQLRFGARRWRGIPQRADDNRRLVFAEAHGYF